MKIAIMMRAMDQDTGFRTYVERLVDALIRIAPHHHFLLLYRQSKWFGTFRARSNVTERLVRPGHKLLWDQIGVAFRLWREKADVVFNPKFSVPIISPCPVTMGLQEPAWWAHPDHHPWWDVLYMRIALPIYLRRCAHVFPWSTFDLSETRKYLGRPVEHATVAYPAPAPHFRELGNAETEQARVKYDLPDRFVLSVTRVENIGNSGTTFTDTKNVQTSLKAYALIRRQVPHELVIVGRRIREYLATVGWSDEDLVGVRFLDFVPNAELPALYNLAEAFIVPSFYEGFGFTLVEAMACGCPVVASMTGACPETSGGAALLADPRDPGDFADKLVTVLENDRLRSDLRRQGLERARFFSWDLSATLVLRALENAARQDPSLRSLPPEERSLPSRRPA